MRFLKEFFNPKLKCKRIGHNKCIEKADIRYNSHDSWRVAFTCESTRKICSRCDTVFTEWAKVGLERSIQGLEMDSDTFKRFRKRSWMYD